MNTRKIKLVIICAILSGLFLYSFKSVIFRWLGEGEEEAYTIRINEICPANLSVVHDEEGNFPGSWIELYNAGSESVNLKGWRLTNQSGLRAESILPDIELKAGKYQVIYLDSEAADGMMKETPGQYYLGYELMRDTAQIVSLYNAGDELIDYMVLPKRVPVDISYGRLDEMNPSGCGGMECTPWTANSTNEIALPVLEEPILSADSGFYADGFYLTMAAEAGQVIHYTLDGSMPDLSSPTYTGALYLDSSMNPNEYALSRDLSAMEYYVPERSVDKAVVVRARAFDNEGNESPDVTRTYFIDSPENSMYEKYGKNIATLSIVADPQDLFGYEDGIMVLGKVYDQWIEHLGEEPENKEDYHVTANFRCKGHEWEREADITYFEKNEYIFQQNLGIRMRGKAGSTGPQKGFGIYARDLYGDGVLQYDIWNAGYNVKRMIMRKDECIMRDGFIMSLVTDREAGVLHYQPVFLFINGEFWGTYALMERYDQQYYHHYYKIDKDNIVILKNGNKEVGTDEDREDWKDVLKFAGTHDLSIPENYDEICRRVDIDSLIDYYFIQIYIDNCDCTENFNVIVWKAREPEQGNTYADGKWRWTLYDINSTLTGVTRNNLSERIRENRSAFLEHSLIKALLQNEEFRGRFIERSLDMLQNNFAPEKVLPEFDRAFEEVREALELTHERFSEGSYGDGAVEQEYEQMYDFWAGRRDYVLKYLQEYFQLSEEEIAAAANG